MFKNTHIPAIPMIAILEQYAYANQLPFNRSNWKTITRVYEHYSLTAKYLN